MEATGATFGMRPAASGSSRGSIPTLPAACGLDVALILDLSGSVGAQLPNLKSAANTFVDSLVGTPSRMAIFSFSERLARSRRHPELPRPDLGLDPSRRSRGSRARYAPGPSAGGTNWDRGFASGG